jgi:hypothetical protein
VLIPLLGGAYEARSVIANAQRCLNLYVETNPVDAPVPITHYPTPGLKILSMPPNPAPGRGLYYATGNTLYCVVGDSLYFISPTTFEFNFVGTFTDLHLTTPTKMIDNEVTLFVVDGTPRSYLVDLTTKAFTLNSDPNYQGSDFVDYLDTFLLFNKPNTPQFYSTLSSSLKCDPLYFSNMTGRPTDLVAAVSLHGTVWLIGKRATEIWFDAGDTNVFPFQRMPQAVTHQGCSAKYSVTRVPGNDDSQSSVFWLSETDDGENVVLQGQGYAARRVSNFAIEDIFRKYPTVQDAEGWSYSQGGHPFYMLNFPTADATWGFDLSTGQWHERAWLDTNGIERQHRIRAAAFAYDQVVAIDRENGTLYKVDLDEYTDFGGPIKRVRSWPHLRQEMRRVIYTLFRCDIEVGTDPDATPENPAMMSLRWSDDHGRSWGNPVLLSVGAEGQYLTSPTKWRLGMARDRVFELSWTTPAPSALNGAYTETIPLVS